MRIDLMGVTATTTPTPEGLTTEKLLDAMRKVRELLPPGIDLYGHDLDETHMYELPHALKVNGRRFICVPRKKLDEIFLLLQKEGVDVRHTPITQNMQEILNVPA